ncbi:hypothetical protein [Streptomyces sp. NEAU-NA10]|uniref:nSTAND1 domain-containing NTPase n=1 Tax=Streptomyces sp. NEAU-NA10 TaxID=3416050 RepID=UPI003CC5C7CC
MGRPERPVDPEAGPVQRLAHELRELRRAAGGPAYRTMARAAGFSATTLSQAAAGERLPSLAVLQGYVRACGGDPQEWEPRWKEAEAAAAGEEGDGAAPYRGLARFETDDRHLFFGRDRMVEELNRLVSDHRLAVLFGPSGSGKSSLLRAGLLPRLREEIARRGGTAVLRVLTPGARPAQTYGHLLRPAADAPVSWVVVDQFEEVFTLCRDRAERTRFIDLLLAARAPASRLRVLLTVRADFYARCAEHRGLADALSGAGLLLGPMTADELREAVVRPAQAAGLLVERELTARIVDEVLDQPGGLPMLSHALLETWRRRRGRMLTLAAYEAAGGVRGAIAATAEKVYGELSPPQATTARHLLLRLVAPGQEGTPDTRRPLTRAELDAWADPSVPLVVERLASARLLTAAEDGVQLAHEALLTCWPRLHGWLQEDRERLRHHRRLTDAARVWLEHDRDPGTLYRGSRLARLEELFPDHARDSALTAPERAFVRASLTARAVERRTAARSARRSRTLVAALSAVLAVALLAGVTACNQARENARQRTDTAARRIAAVADGLRTTDPRAAMLLGVAAWRVSPLPESRRALLGALAQPEQDTFTDPAPGDGPGRFLADSGRTLLSVADGRWTAWDVTTHRRTRSGRLPDGTDTVQAVSPDARLLAVSTADGPRLWDTRTARWAAGPRRPPSGWYDLGFNPGGDTYLLSGIDDDWVQLRSTADGRLLSATRGTAGSANVAVAPDGDAVMTCPVGAAPTVRRAGRTVPGAWQRASGVCTDTSALVPAPPGTARFAALTDTGVEVWDTRTGRALATLPSPAAYATFSPDGSFLATADRSEVRVWRLSSPATPVFRRALNNQHLYGGLAWDPAHPVLRYLEGGTVHSLDVTAPTTKSWRARPLADTLLSPDGRTLATAERTGTHYTFRLLPTNGTGTPRTLPAPPLPVSRDRALPVVLADTLPLMTFSPDGSTLAYGVAAPGREAAPQRITVWDVRGDHATTSLDLAPSATDPAGAVLSLALSPDARTLYAARTERVGTVVDEAWNVPDGRRTPLPRGLTGIHLAVRPDGGLLLSDTSTVPLPSGRSLRRDLVQGEQIGALAFDADGSLLAAGDMTGRVALWDGALRRRSGVLRNVFPAPLGDTPEAVAALALSPDGRTLAVGGEAGALHLWDIATQQPLGDPVPTAGEAIESLSFSPDSTTLYASGTHVPLQRYVIDPARVVAQVCARAGAGLTKEQWRTYVPDAGYRRTCD